MISAVAQLDAARAALDGLPGAAERAMARALNRASIAGRQQAVEAITERYAVSAGAVRDRISLTSATPSKLEVKVVARSPAISLGDFPHSPTEGGTGGPGKRALTAEVLRGSAKTVAGAFVAQVPSGLRIFKRNAGGTLDAIRTVPIAVMLGVDSVREAVEARALAMLDARLEHEIDRELEAVGR